MSGRKIINKILRPFGYNIIRISQKNDQFIYDKIKRSYYLYQYKDGNGKFDYQKYKNIQSEGNKNKINNVWTQKENIVNIANYIKERINNVNFGLCHGTRRGLEQKWFQEELGCEVLGTEISDTAESFPSTVQWDFHEINPEWIEKADFIYSNSFDHAYDPEKALNAWMACLKPGGFCFIEHTSAHEPSGASELDPFGALLEIMPWLILQWGKGRYCAHNILNLPKHHESVKSSHAIVIQNID